MLGVKGGGSVKWFRGGLVFKAHGLSYHSTLGLREIKKKKRIRVLGARDREVTVLGLDVWGLGLRSWCLV